MRTGWAVARGLHVHVRQTPAIAGCRREDHPGHCTAPFRRPGFPETGRYRYSLRTICPGSQQSPEAGLVEASRMEAGLEGQGPSFYPELASRCCECEAVPEACVETDWPLRPSHSHRGPERGHCKHSPRGASNCFASHGATASLARRWRGRPAHVLRCQWAQADCRASRHLLAAPTPSGPRSDPWQLLGSSAATGVQWAMPLSLRASPRPPEAPWAGCCAQAPGRRPWGQTPQLQMPLQEAEGKRVQIPAPLGVLGPGVTWLVMGCHVLLEGDSQK